MDLAGAGRVFQHRHQQIAHSLQPDLARSTGPRAGDQRVDAAAIEHLDPEANHAVRAVELLADCGTRDAQEQRADANQPDKRAAIGRGFHRHLEFLKSGVFAVGMNFQRPQRRKFNITLCKVQGKFCLADVYFGNLFWQPL